MSLKVSAGALRPATLSNLAMSTGGLRSKPIVLVPIRPRQAVDSDSTFNSIPTPIPLGLYESVHAAGASAHKALVPPLAYFCLRALVGYADQVHSLGSHRIKCQPEVLRALSPPTFDDNCAATRCFCKLDPRLWSIIVQVYSGLPEGLRSYYIPLGDRYLPLLQAIPSTPSFALITILNLTSCVSDETSHALKSLHGLCALDISNTSISHLGIRHFAPAPTTETPELHYGTRGLRILRLNNCRNITDQVIGAVSNFPLLALLDIRGTDCTYNLDSGAFRRSKKCQRDLFQCSLQDALRNLRDSDSRNILFSHPDPFVIHVNAQFHPFLPQRPDRPKLAPTPCATPSIQQRLHLHQDPLITKAEQELREWIHSVLGHAANEPRISQIADFIVQHWRYDPEGTESNGGCDMDSNFPWEGPDEINSWDEEDLTESDIKFCGYKVGVEVLERVRELVNRALEEHESAIRFYGLDSRAPKAAFCHCRKLQIVATSPAESMLPDRYHMLIRDPPPWDAVYGPDVPLPRKIRPGIQPSLSESSHLNPGRSSARAKKSVQQVLGMIMQRSLPTTITTPSLSPTPTVSKNPFGKNSTRGLKDLHWRQGGSPDCVPDSPAPKRMKSISQIPVPPRPTPPTMSQSARAKDSNDGPSCIVPKKYGNLKQATLLEVFGKRT